MRLRAIEDFQAGPEEGPVQEPQGWRLCFLRMVWSRWLHRARTSSVHWGRFGGLEEEPGHSGGTVSLRLAWERLDEVEEETWAREEGEEEEYIYVYIYI